MKTNPSKSGRNVSLPVILIAFNVLLATAVVFLLVQHFKTDNKIAYVDSGKLLGEYKGAETARKEFEKKSAEWKANVDTLEKEVKEAIKKYEKEVSGLSRKEQQLSFEHINKKRRELLSYQRAINENAQQENSKLMQSVVSTINSHLLDYGKQHGYSMILIANPSGTIAYARDGMDVTAGVLEELNSQYLSAGKQ